MSELKSCPFCGGDAQLIMTRKSLPDFEGTDGGDWIVVCKRCNTAFAFFGRSREAVTASWNRRFEDGRKSEDS